MRLISVNLLRLAYGVRGIPMDILTCSERTLSEGEIKIIEGKSQHDAKTKHVDMYSLN